MNTFMVISWVFLASTVVSLFFFALFDVGDASDREGKETTPPAAPLLIKEGNLSEDAELEAWQTVYNDRGLKAWEEKQLKKERRRWNNG